MKLPSTEYKRFIVHILERIIDIQKVVQNREQVRRNVAYMHAKRLLTYMRDSTTPDTLEYRLKRPEARLLHSQVTSIKNVLVSSSIPTYLQRIDALTGSAASDIVDKDRQVARYRIYIEKNKHRVKMCDEILKILEKEL